MTKPRPTIQRIALYRVKLPLRQLYVSSMYVMKCAFRTIIELETDDGCIGLGETSGTQEAFQLTARMAHRLLRRDPLERLPLQHSFAASAFENRNGRNGWSAYGGLELALWDWAGHHFGLPACTLIGGRHREWIDVVCPVPALLLEQPVDRSELPSLFRQHDRIAAVVEYCLQQQKQFGFKCFKYKSAGMDFEWDVQVMRALRHSLKKDTLLRWDPNAAYPVAQATIVCGWMEDLELEFYEDPTDDISGMAALRARVRTPVATNMCVVQLDHLASAIRHRPADVLLADVYMWGGIENYLTMAATAEAYGFEVAIHSLFETGIGTAANLHLAAALPQIRRANDSGFHVLKSDIVQDGPLYIENGRMPVPDKPGWGVTLNTSALAQLSVERAEVV
jgi:glucarate dehydratase